MMIPPETIRAQLLEAFEIDRRLPGIERPKGFGSAMLAMDITREEIAATEAERAQLAALAKLIAEIIREIRTGLMMSGEKDDLGKIAETMRGRVPVFPGLGDEWTAATVGAFLGATPAKDKLIAPDEAEVAMMDERMAWLEALPIERRKMLIASFLAERAGRSQRSVARRFGMSPIGFNKAMRRACEEIGLAVNSPPQRMAA